MAGFHLKRFNTKRAIFALSTVVIIYSILALLLLDVEKEAPNRNIHSTQDAFWYLAQTLTTVGYGDAMPVTYYGKIIGFVFLVSSLGVYGFIIGQIANFMNTRQENKMLGFNGTNFKNHVVIIGWNDFAQSVISHLIGAGRQVAVVTKDRTNIDIIREYYSTDQVYTLFSDYNNYDLIEKCNIREASIIFVNLNDDTEKLVYVINMKKRYPTLNYVVTLDNGNLKSTFLTAGVTYTISKNEISSKLLASYIYEPDVAIFSEELIAYAHEEDEYDLKQILVKEGNPFAGIPYEKSFFDLKQTCNVILIGLVKIINGERKMLKNPEGSIRIEAGDYLVMMMDGKGESKLKRHFHIQEGV
jgi:voltage-gated potassium channel